MHLPRHRAVCQWTLYRQYMEEKKKCCTVTESSTSSQQKELWETPLDPAFCFSLLRLYLELQSKPSVKCSSCWVLLLSSCSRSHTHTTDHLRQTLPSHMVPDRDIQVKKSNRSEFFFFFNFPSVFFPRLSYDCHPYVWKNSLCRFARCADAYVRGQ